MKRLRLMRSRAMRNGKCAFINASPCLAVDLIMFYKLPWSNASEEKERLAPLVPLVKYAHSLRFHYGKSQNHIEPEREIEREDQPKKWLGAVAERYFVLRRETKHRSFTNRYIYFSTVSTIVLHCAVWNAIACAQPNTISNKINRSNFCLSDVLLASHFLKQRIWEMVDGSFFTPFLWLFVGFASSSSFFFSSHFVIGIVLRRLLSPVRSHEWCLCVLCFAISVMQLFKSLHRFANCTVALSGFLHIHMNGTEWI